MARARKPVDGGGEALGALAAVTISTGEFAKLVGLTTAAVGLRVSAGFIPKAGHGQFNLVQAVQGFLRYEIELAAKAQARAASSGRANLNAAKATEIEARLARQMRELIHRESADFVIDKLVAVTVDEVRKVPKHLPVGIIPKARAEIDGSITRIRAAGTKAKNAMKTGNIEGAKL